LHSGTFFECKLYVKFPVYYVIPAIQGYDNCLTFATDILEIGIATLYTEPQKLFTEKSM